MKIRYSPIRDNLSTLITIIDENSVIIDGEPYEFGVDDILWPTINEQTSSVILEAYRDEAGVLTLTILRHYTTGESLDWDDGQYHAVTT